MVKKGRLSVILIVLFLFALGFWLTKREIVKETEEKKPNLIVISIDSLRADHVSSYGYSRKTTPNIDNLARDGILFKNYITQAYLTPISEMALHTGMYPGLSGVIGFETVLPESTLTLAQILKIYDYRTAAFGNSPEFLVYPALKESFRRGFDIYNFIGGPSISRKVLFNQNKIFNFLEEKKEKPFFLWLAVGSVHFPYGGFPRVFGDLNYNGPLKDLEFSWFTSIRWVFNNVFYKTKDKKITESINLGKEDIQNIIDKYDDGIFATDKWIDEFLKELKKRGLDKNTIIILASEHGEEFNEHGYVMHYDIFDGTIKAPLIIKNPKLKKGGLVIENQVQSIDVLPTILDFLGISKPHQAEGNSLIPLIAGKTAKDFNEYIFIERIPLWERVMFQISPLYEKTSTEKQADFYAPDAIKIIKSDPSLYEEDFAIRTNEWKLIYRKSKDFQEKYSWWKVLSKSGEKLRDYELYNLKMDPLEKENVIDEYPAIAETLKEKLEAFVKKIEEGRIEVPHQTPIQEYF